MKQTITSMRRSTILKLIIPLNGALSKIKEKNYPFNMKSIVQGLFLMLLFTLANVKVNAQCGVDIYVLNDNSGSVDAIELRQSKKFITRLATELTPLGISPTQTRIAIGDFSGNNSFLQYDFPISNNNYTTEFADIVYYENAPRVLWGGTDVSDALSKASILSGLPAIPGRNVAQVLIILTDAYSAQISPSIVGIANLLKSRGFSIVVMAIDDAIASPELPLVASSGAYFTAGDYQALENNVISYTKSLVAKACTFVPPIPNPDLKISMSGFTVTNCTTTPNYAVNYAVNNIGTAGFSGNLYISLYNGNPAIPGTSLLGVYNAGTVNIGANASSSGTITDVNIPNLNTAKSLYALVNFNGAAAGNQVPVLSPINQSQLFISPEINAQNNISNRANLISGSGCDLAVLDVAVTAEGGVCNDVVKYTMEVCNTGTKPAILTGVQPFAAPGFVLTGSTVPPTCSSVAAFTQLGVDINGTSSSNYLGETSTDLSANGNTMAIGTRYPAGPNQKVSVYDWNGTAWLLRGAAIPYQNGDEGFGSNAKLSADGNTVAIGAYYYGGLAAGKGAVYVFDWNGSAWVLRGNVIAGTFNGEHIGCGSLSTVTIDMTGDGNTVILGSFSRSAADVGPYTGSASIYDWNGTAWERRGYPIPGIENHSKFGRPAISDDGNIVVIGAPDEGGGGYKRGSVRAYQWDGSEWIQHGSTIFGTVDQEFLGYSVEMTPNGNTFVVGGGNKASIYDWVGADWLLRGSDIATAAYSTDISGDGNIIIVGNYMYGNPPGVGTGIVKIYDWNGTNWVQRVTNFIQPSTNGIGTATAISRDGSTVGIASPYAQISGMAWAGLVQAFRYPMTCGTLASGSCVTYTYTYDVSAAAAGTHDFDAIVTATKADPSHANPIINPDKNFTAQNTATVGDGFDGSNHFEDNITLYGAAFCATPHTIGISTSLSRTLLCIEDYTTATVTIMNPYPINLYGVNLTLNLNIGSVFSSDPYNLSNISLPAGPSIIGFTGNKTIPVYVLTPGVNTFQVDISAKVGTTNFTAQLKNIDTAYNNGTAISTVATSNVVVTAAPFKAGGTCPADVTSAATTINVGFGFTGATTYKWNSGTNGVFANKFSNATIYTINLQDKANGYVDFILTAYSAAGCETSIPCRVNITGESRDFGDAPISYDLGATTIPVAAAHTLLTGLYLGVLAPDAESANQPSVNANLEPEDDGLQSTVLTVLASVTYTLPVTVTNTTGKQAYVNAFIDWNTDGDFLDSTESATPVIILANSGTSTYNLIFEVPAGLTSPINSYVRLRVGLDSLDIMRSFGATAGGEVEDFYVTINKIQTISGTVFNDLNINTRIDGTEVGTTAGANLYVYLVDAAGIIVDSTKVLPNGNYELQALPNSNYSIELSAMQYSLGTNINTTPINNSLPSGWVSSGENGSGNNTGNGDGTPNGKLSVSIGTTNLIQQNFGIISIQANPDINQTIVNVPVGGTVATNDNVIPGSTFTPIGTMSNGTLVMNPNGSYVYTPNPNFVGRDSISYVVCSPAPVNLCDTTTLTIVVTPLISTMQNTVIAQDDHATSPKDVPVTMCLLCNDSDPNGNTIGNPTVISNPSNGTVVVNANGTVTYTPNPGFVGEDVYQYTICDNGIPVACDTAYAYVTIVNNPISNNQTYANDDAYTTPINTPINNSVAGNDTDPQNDLVNFTLVSGTTNGVLVLNPDGTFTYTPNNGYTGPDQFVYSKCDNGTPVACDTATAYITINKPQQDANPDINQTIVNVPVGGTVATNDNVIPGSTFTPIGTMSNGTLVMNPNGSYFYTPNPNFVGRDSISYVVCSPAPVNLCDTTTLTIIVTPEHKLGTNTVIAQDDHATTPNNTPVDICILCNDNDPQGDSIGMPTVISNPSHGTIVINPNGTVTYTPNPNYVGTDVFTYYICDNGTPVACDTADVYIDIMGTPLSVNQTYSNDDAYVTLVGIPVAGNVGLNDTDPQNDDVTFMQVNNPANGTVVFNTDGTFVYTPNSGYAGPDQFIYSKCDNGTPVACDTATVYITIIKINAALPAILTRFTAFGQTCATAIEWTTSQEFNVDFFEIQRKKEGGQFDVIAKKEAVGNSQTIQNYSYKDNNVASGLNEYRLRIVDIDGKSELTSISAVNITCNTTSDIILYPNPSSTTTQLSISTPNELTFDVKMVDAVGKAVYQLSIDLNNEIKLVNIPLDHLSVGIYTIMITDRQNEVKVIRFQKTK